MIETKPKPITIRDVVTGYVDKGDDGVVGYEGRLNIRPSYQRAYIHDNNPKFKKELILSILAGRPINLIYWAESDQPGHYELLDGQQRIITICQFKEKNAFSVKHPALGTRYYSSLPDEEKEEFLNYDLNVYVCIGTDTEKIDWFTVINTGAHQLSPQEIRNATYNSPWVDSAKFYFSSKGNRAKECSEYMSGYRERQEHLECILKWIAGPTKDAINDYMALQSAQHDNAKHLWDYFENIRDWIRTTFPRPGKIKMSNKMVQKHKAAQKKVHWGRLYKEYGKRTYDAGRMVSRFQELLLDDEVENKHGIFEYLLSREDKRMENLLRLRNFDAALKKRKWLEQGKRCAYFPQGCHTPRPELSLEDAHADHIVPWSKGGLTKEDNCQILCGDCNRRKSNSL